MVSCLTDLAKTFVEKLINGAVAELRPVFCFTCIANEFEENKVWLEAERRTLEQRVKVAAGRDKDIQANVRFWEEKVDKLIQEDIKTKQTCFFGFCPDCIWRYKRGKDLANKTEEIKRLTEKGEKLENIELPRRLPDVERYSSEYYIPLESRVSKYKELLDALKDDKNYIIGLQGMGGTGKTTLAKEVGKELKQSEQFSHVIDTTVSFTPNIKKIQDDIAGPLGLTWEDCNDSDRSKKLWSRLTNGDKILLIMDDVWDQDPLLDFDPIGIPKRGNHKGCRIFITTRSKQIFHKMGCDKSIELDLLSEEESWTVFKRYANISDSSSKNLISKGHKIAKECKGLPVAIAVIASSLKGQQLREYEWDATLKSLKKPMFMHDVHDDLAGIYKCLKFSYDYMKDEKAKGLFLLSSVFPEDVKIPVESLTRLGVGTGLFGENYVSYDDARTEVVIARNKLIDSCLLVEVDEGCVKMHDLIRDAAQWIANKEIQSVNWSNKGQKSSVQRKTNIKHLFFEGKDTDLFSCKYDGSKLETLIVEVDRDEDCKCMEVPNSFFENIVKLRVLFFSGSGEPLSLPHSIQSLVNIRSILVDQLDLGDISVLGNLQSLETLDLVRCGINELPPEITKLGKFKLLNLKHCEIRINNPFEVIERCSALEELCFVNSFNDFCLEITLPELQRYCIHKGWSVLDDSGMVNDSVSKSVSIDAFDDAYHFSKETFKYCMQTSEVLKLNGIKEGWRNLMPEIVPIHLGMNDLVELRLRDISQLQCLIESIGSQVPNVLSNLVVLKLHSMENLEELFNGFLSFDSLKNLEKLSIKYCESFRSFFNCKLNLCNLKTVTLRSCPMLVSLFPLLTSRNLVLLEKLEIADCEGLKNIITDERGEEESIEETNESDNDNKISHVSVFPKLKFLYIEECHQLESILPNLSSQDLPVLEAITIRRCEELKYIFGQYQHVELGSLKQIELCKLPNFKGMFPKHSHSITSLLSEPSSTSRDDLKAQKQLDPIKCNMFSWSCICCHGRHKHGSMPTTSIPPEDQRQDNTITVSNWPLLQIWERAECLPVQPHIMCNIKEITLFDILKIKSVFILSIAPRMLVETLRIGKCHDLKHLIVDTDDHESGGNNWDRLFPKLKSLYVEDCMQLEYIFGHYTEDHQNHTEIHLHLPALQSLNLCNLPCLVDMCPKQYCTTFPSLKELEIDKCSQVAVRSVGEFFTHPVSESPNSLNMKASNSHHLQIWEHAQCLPIQPHIMCNIKEITLSHILKIKSMFILSIAPRMLVETLTIRNCDELKHLIVDIGDHESGSNNWGNVFPKLKSLYVKDCMQLEYIFGHYKIEGHQNHTEIHLHLPALQRLNLFNLPSLVDMCPKQYRTTFSSLRKLKLKKCSQAAIKSIGEFIIHPISKSPESINMKEVSGNVEHFNALEILKVYDSKAENIFCLNEIDGTQMNLRLQIIKLYDLNDMMCLFVGPKNSFALNYLTSIRIVHCDMLEIVFSTSILRCLSQLVHLRVEECKELKYIIEDDNDMHNQNLSNSLSSTTCFPMLEALVAMKCHKLKSVFPVSICKEIPQLKTLMIIEADEMEEIFKNEGHQKVKTPNLDFVVFVKLPSLFHTQGIQFQAAKNHFVQNCQNLSLTSASTPDFYPDLDDIFPDSKTRKKILGLFRQLRRESEARDRSNEKPSAETTEEVSVVIEVEAALGHKLISSQIQMKQTLEAEHAIIENDPHLEIPSEPLVNEQSTSKQCLTNQKHPHGQIDTTIKPSQGNDCLNEIEDQRFQEGYSPVRTVAATMSTISDTRNQPTIQLVSPKQKCVEEGTTLTNAKLITASTHLESVSSLQEKDVDVREATETAKTNDDHVSLKDNAHMKISSIIEEQFPTDDEFRVSKSKPFPSNSIPLPLAFQTPSIPSKVCTSQIMVDFSSPSIVMRELEQLVSNKHLDYENLSLLTDFLVKHPSVLLSDTSLSNRYKGYAYSCLAELLKFLQTHSLLDVLGSSQFEFNELLKDVRKFDFDKDWLDGVNKRVLCSDLQFSQDALLKLLDSKKQVTKDVEVMRLEIDILTQRVEDRKHQLASSEAALGSIIQQEAQILETKVALSAPLGY